MTEFEHPRSMSISVAGGVNSLLLHPPLPDEVFAGLLWPYLVGKKERAPITITQYSGLYTALSYEQSVDQKPSASPVKYGAEVCEYLGSMGVQVEFDTFIYESSPQSLVIMATEPPKPKDVQGSARYF